MLHPPYHLIRLPVADSTNHVAEQLIESPKTAEWTVVWADEQTAGKGLGNNTWESEAGKNLTFSIILHPRFLHPADQFRMNKAIALGITDHVKKLLPQQPVKIKWPNDVYIGPKKLGGILIQHFISGDAIASTIIGIGLNVNQDTFSPGLPNPVSLKQVMGKRLSLERELDMLLDTVAGRYDSLREGNEAGLDAAFNENLLGYGECGRFISKGQEFSGTVKGADGTGRLVILAGSGKLLSFSHGDVRQLTGP